MTSPLLSIGAATAGSLALTALRQLQPGGFIRELLAGSEESATSAAHAAAAPVLNEKVVDLTRAVPQLGETLRQRFLAAGIDLSQPIVLKDDGRGDVVVDGDHPDRAAIERIISSDAKLRSDFLAIATAATQERDERLGLSGSEFRFRLAGGAGSIRFE